MLEVQAVEVSIGPTPILRNVSLAVATGRVDGLLGRNGAGKTTFLRACMGLIAPRGGSIRFAGEDLTRMPAFRRAALGIGYMPEDRRLVPDMTAEENILVPAWATGGAAGARDRLAFVYDLIPEIGPLRARPAAALSGGQQKLVALARALLPGRRLLLLDEPSEGVAPALAQRILAILAGLRDEGPTVLIAESDGRRLASLVHGLHVIERGEIAPDRAAAGVI